MNASVYILCTEALGMGDSS